MQRILGWISNFQRSLKWISHFLVHFGEHFVFPVLFEVNFALFRWISSSLNCFQLFLSKFCLFQSISRWISSSPVLFKEYFALFSLQFWIFSVLRCLTTWVGWKIASKSHFLVIFCLAAIFQQFQSRFLLPGSPKNVILTSHPQFHCIHRPPIPDIRVNFPISSQNSFDWVLFSFRNKFMCSDRFIVSLFVYWISRPRDNRNLIIAVRSFCFHDNFAPIRCDTGTFHLLDAINYLFVCGRDKGIFRFFLICWKLREERNPPKSNCELWKRHWKPWERQKSVKTGVEEQ